MLHSAHHDILTVQPCSCAMNRHCGATLVDTHECNNDPTNYWIFSEAGLKRTLARSGWDLQAWMKVGCTDNSNPAANDRDERAFVMARSRYRSG